MNKSFEIINPITPVKFNWIDFCESIKESKHDRACGYCSDKSKWGYLYLIKGNSRHTKIGITHNCPSKRFKEIEASHWNRLRIEYVCFLNYPIDYEQILHKCFKKYRCKGEWFQIPSLTIYELTYEPKQGLNWEKYDEDYNYQRRIDQTQKHYDENARVA